MDEGGSGEAKRDTVIDRIRVFLRRVRFLVSNLIEQRFSEKTWPRLKFLVLLGVVGGELQSSFPWRKFWWGKAEKIFRVAIATAA